MIYSNLEYLLLLIPTVLLFILFERSIALRFALLTISSLIFYSWLSVIECFVFLFVVLFSWAFLALASLDPKRKKMWITSGIIVMTVHLFFWKYSTWVCSVLFALNPEKMQGSVLIFPLPAGISFFTLQGIGYLVDYARGEVPVMSFKKYLLFKSFFPQLVAGPIVRAKEMIPQMESLRIPRESDLWAGASLFILGFMKKTLLADRLAIAVDSVYANPGSYNWPSLALAGLGFTVQIWFDFSGYTDMGRGSARMLGFHLPENFLSPYMSKGLAEFWRRWHITLGTWIRDYIFFPLGGSRGSMLRSSLVLVLTMTISGLWHGAAFSYVIFGVTNGVWLAVERIIRTYGKWKLPGLLQWFLFFILWILSMIIFRSISLKAMGDYFLGLFYFQTGPLNAPIFNLVLSTTIVLFIMQAIMFVDINSARDKLPRSLLSKYLDKIDLEKRKNQILCAAILGLAFTLALFFRPGAESNAFIYFKF